MASISQIIDVQVKVSVAAPSRAAFGIPLILTEHTVTANRSDSFTSLSGMVAAGFSTHSKAYRWAQALFSQSPRPPKVKIGRIDAGDANLTAALVAVRESDPKWYLLLCPDTFDAVVATERSNVIEVATWAEGERVLYLAESGATNILAAGDTLASALKAGGFTRTALAWHEPRAHEVTLTFDKPLVAANQFVCDVNGTPIAPVIFAVDHDTTMAAIAVAIAQVAGVASATVTVVAGPDNDLQIVVTSADPWAELEITNALVGAGAGQPSVSVATSITAAFPLSASWAGRMLPKDPGSANWANQANLALVVANNLTDTAIGIVEGQNANYYAPFTDDLRFTRLGTCASGLFCDQRRGLDALTTDLEDAVLSLFAGADKVPKTDDGVQVVKNTIISVLQRYKRANFLTGDVEQAVDTTAATWTGRNLSGIVINAVGAGALNGLAIVVNFTE